MGGNESDARLWEISENLHRAELTALERSEHIAEWVRLTGKKGAQNEPPSKGRQPHDKGIKAAVRELGLERNEAQRAIKIDSLTPQGKEAARTMGLDKKQSALLVIAGGATPEEQVQRAEKEAEKARQISQRRESRRRVKAAGDQIVQHDAHEAAALLIVDYMPRDRLQELLLELDAARHHKLTAAIRRELTTGDRRADRPVFDNTRHAV